MSNFFGLLQARGGLLEYRKCKLYKLQSKKQLREWLGIDNPSFFRYENLVQNTRPKIMHKGDKKRLVDTPFNELKFVQSNILHFLTKLDYPEYLFSGLKKRCFIDNARYHIGAKYIFKLDISKFFPNIKREKVYKFFRYALQTSPDVATILANCTTANLEKATYKNDKIKTEVEDFVKEHRLPNCHLSTGSPASMLLAYLCNKPMFDKIYKLINDKSMKFSIYADDITISSTKPIEYQIREKIVKIISSYGFSVSKNKSKYYTEKQSKIVTGVAIDRHGKVRTPNKLLLKAHSKICEYKRVNLEIKSWQSLRGTIGVSNMIDGKFSQLINKMKHDTIDFEKQIYQKN